MIISGQYCFVSRLRLLVSKKIATNAKCFSHLVGEFQASLDALFKVCNTMSLLFNRQFQEESEKNALQVKSERTVSHLLTVNESQLVMIFAVQRDNPGNEVVCG